MDAPTIELMSALASYPVHRALLASRSAFFDGACRHPFQEAETGVIDLSEDDPEAVEHMVHYFYHLDYLNRPLSRRSSQRSSRRTSLRAQHTASRAPRKLNLALIEDSLLAMASAVDASMPMTPPADQDDRSHIDAIAKQPDTPMAEQFDHDTLDCAVDDVEADAEKPHLITHAKVYAIAEKYAIAGLKTLAKQKFAHQIAAHLDSNELPEACQEAYESTVDSDRGLRDVIIQTFRSHPDLSLRKDMEAVVRDTPSLAFELFRMASGLPVTS